MPVTQDVVTRLLHNKSCLKNSTAWPWATTPPTDWLTFQVGDSIYGLEDCQASQIVYESFAFQNYNKPFLPKPAKQRKISKRSITEMQWFQMSTRPWLIEWQAKYGYRSRGGSHLFLFMRTARIDETKLSSAILASVVVLYTFSLRGDKAGCIEQLRAWVLW